jgi:uncharacterized membrane protein
LTNPFRPSFTDKNLGDNVDLYVTVWFYLVPFSTWMLSVNVCIIFAGTFVCGFMNKFCPYVCSFTKKIYP